MSLSIWLINILISLMQTVDFNDMTSIPGDIVTAISLYSKVPGLPMNNFGNGPKNSVTFGPASAVQTLAPLAMMRSVSGPNARLNKCHK